MKRNARMNFKACNISAARKMLDLSIIIFVTCREQDLFDVHYCAQINIIFTTCHRYSISFRRAECKKV